MNRITNYIQKESNNVKLLLMLFLSLLVLTIATKGQFFSLNQMQLVAYLFPEMGVLALGMMLAVSHNLYFYNSLTYKIREALDVGYFYDFYQKYHNLPI